MNEPFDAKGYAARVMRSKGYMLKRLPDGTYLDIDADINAVFSLQWPSWKALIEKHRLDADPQRAEQVLTGFGHREVIGGASKVLETFAKHLEAQPRQGGSPDWSQAATEESDCPYCDNRGIVSDIPCRVIRQGVEVDRKYSFACVCRSGDRFPGMRKAEDWMIRFASDRKYTEADRLHRWRQERDAAGDTIADFRGGYRAWLDRQIQARKDLKSGVFGRRQPSGSMAKAYKALEDVRPTVKTKPPEKLNPDRLALAVYANGDERNEWE
jgi:hypothetical protein